MKVIAKKGFEIELEIKGEYREHPLLKVSFEAFGKKARNARCELDTNFGNSRLYLPELNGRIEIEPAEMEKIQKAVNELPEETTKEIDADGDIVVVEIKKEEPKAEPKPSTKRGIENIIFDNESEGIDKFNGIGVDKFAMVGIENAKTETENATEAEGKTPVALVLNTETGFKWLAEEWDWESLFRDTEYNSREIDDILKFLCEYSSLEISARIKGGVLYGWSRELEREVYINDDIGVDSDLLSEYHERLKKLNIEHRLIDEYGDEIE